MDNHHALPAENKLAIFLIRHSADYYLRSQGKIWG
jgi:hypothetical protein